MHCEVPLVSSGAATYRETRHTSTQKRTQGSRFEIDLNIKKFVVYSKLCILYIRVCVLCILTLHVETQLSKEPNMCVL